MSSTDYDVHGNIKADGQRSFSYNQADMVTTIAKGADSTKFEYAPDNSRIYREDERNGNTTKTWYVGKIYEFSEKGSDTEQRWYLGNVVMSQSSKVAGTNFEVLHGDAQGSTVTVTDGSGKLMSHSLYDAWGQQSVLQVGSTNQLFVQSLQRRAYTGHENVEGLGIIHMNGRIYDPLLARFVQADPTLQFVQYSQGYNRYSYVLNNPMSYTDPSGYFLSSPFKFVKNGLRSVIRALGPEVSGMIVAIGSIFCGPGYAACVAAGNYEIARAHGASVTGALRGAAAAGVMAYFNPAPKPGFTDIAIQGISLINPDAGRVLRFTQYGIDSDIFKDDIASGMQNLYTYAAHEYVNSKVSEELGRFAQKNGMTLNEFNALLTLGSFAGNKIAGSRYRGEREGTELIDGLGRRGGKGYESFGLSEFNPLSLPFDAMDYLLGTQGLLTASAHEYAQKGNRSSPLVGYSLGAMDVGNLAARGYAKNAYAYSLPLLNVGVGSLGVMNGRYDPVNFFKVGWLFSPHATWSDATLIDHSNYENYPGLDLYDWRPKK